MEPGLQDGQQFLINKAVYHFHNPHRGEIIVFHSPRDPNSDLIKRIIAVPGDTIEIKDNTVFVNDTPIVETYTLEPPHYMLLRQDIPTNHYFVLGDNRNNSADSHRGWTVPLENIIGRAWITYWPPQKWRALTHYTLISDTQAAHDSKPSLITETLCQTK